jgi:hypothetical protein
VATLFGQLARAFGLSGNDNQLSYIGFTYTIFIRYGMFAKSDNNLEATCFVPLLPRKVNRHASAGKTKRIQFEVNGLVQQWRTRPEAVASSKQESDFENQRTT